ncbi:Hint domain-containing protein [Roseovarius salinarum]|uniref:Hint domain-containing protein n=1 Tax=Roseovarius salinarum TaxID=1981892 RepID=UPI000C3246E4|nr:Hint domain-containing protein [Roseovarius salinarum]
MADYSFFALPESSVTVSGGGQLDGVTQGDGSHLVGRTITLENRDFSEIAVSEPGRDDDFDDNDGNQRLDGAQTFDGTTYGDGTRIEAEYQFVLEDPDTGERYTVLAVNLNNSSPAYATVEGLAFVDAVPPTGKPLTVVSAAEGPGSGGQGDVPEATIVPICFCAGTRIATPGGPKPVEKIAEGDLVMTADRGPAPVLLRHARFLSRAHLAAQPRHGPVRITAGALGGGWPATDLWLSPQHRVLLRAKAAARMFGRPEVLAPAAQLAGWPGIDRAPAPRGVHYHHLLLDHHAVLTAEGAAVESLLLGDIADAEIPPATLAALRQRHRLPERMTPARPLVKGKRLKRLLWRLSANGHPLAAPGSPGKSAPALIP